MALLIRTHLVRIPHSLKRIPHNIHAVGLLDMETFTIGETQVSKQEWLAWAHNYADQIDPLKQAEPTIIEKTQNMFWSGH